MNPDASVMTADPFSQAQHWLTGAARFIREALRKRKTQSLDALIKFVDGAPTVQTDIFAEGSFGKLGERSAIPSRQFLNLAD